MTHCPPKSQTLFFSSKHNFEGWLRRHGTIIMAPTSEWEVLRAKSITGELLLIYSNARGQLSWNQPAAQAWASYKGNTPWCGALPPRKNMFSKEKQALKAELWKRDGGICLFCGLPCEEGNWTIEHILDRNLGGSDHESNLAVAHHECNLAAADYKGLRRKIEFILSLRKKRLQEASDEIERLLHDNDRLLQIATDEINAS